MSAPTYVPATENDVSSYTSPPRRAEAWRANRPGETLGDEEFFGAPGPDQGYAIKLARRFEDRLQLDDSENPVDVLASAVAVALRRASIFGRAPVVHDILFALELFGALEQSIPNLVAWRKENLTGASGHHGYHICRHLANFFPESTLRATPAQAPSHRPY